MNRLALSLAVLAAAGVASQPGRSEPQPSAEAVRKSFDQQLVQLQDCRAKYAAAVPSVPPYCYADVVISMLARHPSMLSDRLEKAFSTYVTTRPTRTADLAAQQQLLWHIGEGGRDIMRRLSETQALASSEVYARRARVASKQDGGGQLHEPTAGRGWPPSWLMDHVNAQVAARRPFGWTTDPGIDLSIRKKVSPYADQVAAAGARYQRWQRQPATLKALLDTLPKSTLYVELIEYRSVPAAPALWTKRPEGEARYYAFGAWKEAGKLVVRGLDVGKASDVDTEVRSFQRQVRGLFPAEGLGRDLYQRLLGPFDRAVAGAKQLVIAPSGMLSVLPFEALPTPRGYLNDGVVVLYGSARDVLAEKLNEKLVQTPPAAGRGLVLADPAYARNAATGAAVPCAVSTAAPAQALPFPRRFEPLPCTRDEASAIQKASAVGVDVLVGAAATERALRRRDRPRFVHLATHAFFLPHAASAPYDEFSLAPLEQGVFVDPLANGALALTGADGYAENPPHRPSDDDGLLSGSEIQRLNLLGTELVVMSACDTAQGVVGTGNAFYGLRHAFRAAGAAAVVASLWSAGDVTTSWFMTSFYTHLFKGEPAAVALQQARRELRQQCDVCGHPYYWAPFVMEGSASALFRRPAASAPSVVREPAAPGQAANERKPSPGSAAP